MKLHVAAVALSILSTGLIVPIRSNAQINVGPNIAVPPRDCYPGAFNCGAARFSEDMHYNRQIYFQTPEKIIQNFHRDRTQRACLGRTITSPPPPRNPNCDEYLNRIEELDQQTPVILLREAQQEEVNRLFPNVPK